MAVLRMPVVGLPLSNPQEGGWPGNGWGGLVSVWGERGGGGGTSVQWLGLEGAVGFLLPLYVLLKGRYKWGGRDQLTLGAKRNECKIPPPPQEAEGEDWASAKRGGGGACRAIVWGFVLLCC